MEIDSSVLSFFASHMEALPLFEALAEKIKSEIEDVEIRVQKTQISFYRKRLFGCISFLRPRKKQDCPAVFITVTFGLGRPLSSPRIDALSEPYPARWTHHLMLSEVRQIDNELLGWIREAACFAEAK